VHGVIIQRTVAEGIVDRLGEDLTGDPVRVSFHDVPLVAFINAVFGEELGMSFVISPGLSEKSDLVTLKLTEPLPPRQLFSTARRVLGEYGVDLREVEGGVLSFSPSQETATREVPLLVSGRALPEVPPSHRTVFQLVPLEVVRGPQVAGWLNKAFDRKALEILEDPDRNALILKGDVDTLARALAMIEVLDQPLLRGRHGIIIEPVFMEAGELASALGSVLRAEGYQVGDGRSNIAAVIVLTLESVNKVIAFAATPRIIAHVEQWARTLDARRKDTIEEAVFAYEVKNTQAEELVGTLEGVLGGVAPAESPSPPREGGAEDGGEARAEESRASRPGARIVVDENRNLLFFRGSGREWAELREIIRELDKSVPSVLIEVLVAEVSLTDEEQSGFDFVLKGALGSRGVTAGTRGTLGVTTKGLSFTLDSAGQTRAMLNLFYKDDRVVIRSRPRLLVKSGETASIDVGNEIPVITQRSDDQRPVDGSTNIVQEVTYRKTGVQLEIKPLVQANGLVDLQISQQLSEARPGAATSLGGSPTILNRQISTSLTLRDGGSLVMGGLIANNRSAGQTGIPALGRIPGLGRLFRTDTLQEDRTELLIMVIPYVVASHSEGSALTEELKQQLDLHRDFLR
jgi:general secretion pathway protein D